MPPELPFSLFDLTGRVAIVTGGAGLLGAEFCHTLVKAGAHVLIADINNDAAEELAQTLKDKNGSVKAISVDVTNADSVKQMVRTAIESFGRLDILVNSAALDPKFDPKHEKPGAHRAGSGAFENYPLQSWKQALDVNLTGAFLCCQAASTPMLNQGQGVIINISSIYGLSAPDQRLYQRPGEPPQFKPAYYTVTKAGILGLTKYLAAYYAGKNIRVNALSPGGGYNGHDDHFVQSYSSRAILGRMAEKDEMNGALLFLASDASAYMTGTNLIVDGGWTNW